MRGEVDPGPQQARQWLEEELARDEYHGGESALARVGRWLADQLAALQSAPAESGAPSVPPAVSAALLALLLGALALLLTRVRTNRRAATHRRAVLGGVAAGAAELRRRGEAALREHRWDDAVVHYTRAIARDGADRTLLADIPSLTAHEVGIRLAEVFPDHADAVQRCTDVFDAVRYGRYTATGGDAHHVRATCEALRSARPLLSGSSGPGEHEPSPASAAFRPPQ